MGRGGRQRRRASQRKWGLWVEETQGAEKPHVWVSLNPPILIWGRPGGTAGSRRGEHRGGFLAWAGGAASGSGKSLRGRREIETGQLD